MTGCPCDDDELTLDARNATERRTLAAVLGINVAQAVVVGIVGTLVSSVGLMGAALDNLADAGVYGISFYAVGRTIAAKARAARISGTVLILLGLGLGAEVLRRFFGGEAPIGIAMIITATANAATNLVCLRLLRAHREDGVHLKASWIFTSNDMLANAGIVLSGVAVMLTGSRVPDLVIGLVVVAIAIRGGFEILEQARAARNDDEKTADGTDS
jgi:Co/Zn/Cd efflux system component